ncbi:hypothetical protein F6X40_35255, partial [Paraburkholderia sp. UCT31]|uniref:hypothetical protein n=1 Tax=Paraburkholderia sp. UCT31 TaxID=2615209 RepID=UPI0016557B38
MSDYVDELLEDESVKVLVMATSLCRWRALEGAEEKPLSARPTAGDIAQVTLVHGSSPEDLVRARRPDIVLVSTLRTAGKDDNGLLVATLRHARKTGANVVIGRDIESRDVFVVGRA